MVCVLLIVVKFLQMDLAYSNFNMDPMGLADQDSSVHMQVDRKKLRMTTMGMTPEGKRFIQTTSVSQVTCIDGNLLEQIFGSGILYAFMLYAIVHFLCVSKLNFKIFAM
jgi:hypothetical protein